MYICNIQGCILLRTVTRMDLFLSALKPVNALIQLTAITLTINAPWYFYYYVVHPAIPM